MVKISVPHAGRLDALLAESVGAAKVREARQFGDAAGERVDRLVLLGAGGLGRQILAGLRMEGIEPIAFIDNNEDRWGSVIDGLGVIAPEEAAFRYGKEAVFVVTIWGAGSSHRFEHSLAQLRGLGVDVVVPFAWLGWRYPRSLLPHYAMNLPSRLLVQAPAIKEAFNLLADETSQSEYVAQVEWRLGGDTTCLSHPVSGRQYLVDDVYTIIDDEIVLDCGAYDGDTLRDWLSDRGPNFARYIAMEPDPESRIKFNFLLESLPKKVADKVLVLPYAASAQGGTAVFSATGTAASALGNSGDGVTVECARIDDLLDELGGVAPTFVKMDIEGAELSALAGAKKLLKQNKPLMALSAYHRQDHLWRVLLTVSAIQPDYQFFLRPHNEEGWDLVLYAVPPTRRRA
ncbi:MAG: FkbM family methyltransferase [Acidimicrobiales bacterium]